MRILRLFSAIVVAVLTGTLVNSALVTLGHRLIPLPGGLSGNTPESLYASIPLMHAEHFVFPFLAHASGSFVAALLATLISRNRNFWLPAIFGVLFMAGGIYMAVILPAPFWFEAVDLGLAYLPMAWLGHQLALRWMPITA
ncbi:MAG: hypothetical protein ACO3GN_03900 [Bacteroidia bacterium]|jgi:hypothetical protein